MAEARQCAQIESTIRDINQRLPELTQHRVDLHNQLQLIPRKIREIQDQIRTLRQFDNTSGAATDLVRLPIQAKVILDALRVVSVGAGMSILENRLQNRLGDERRLQAELRTLDGTIENTRENLQISEAASRRLGCGG